MSVCRMNNSCVLVFDVVLTSLSSTASLPRSSRGNLHGDTQPGRGHGGTSGGSTRPCS